MFQRIAFILCLSTVILPSFGQTEDAVTYRTNVAHTASQSMPDFSLPAAVRWDVDLGSSPSYPLVAEGKVFVILPEIESASPQSELEALDVVSGGLVWGPVALPSSSNPWAAATYDNGTLFINTEGPLGKGLMAAYSAESGAMLWSTVLPNQGNFTSAPAASNGLIYTGGNEGSLYCVRETDGTTIWTGSVIDGQNASPAIGGGGVFASYACGDTLAFNSVSGVPLWHLNTSCDYPYNGESCALDNGTLFIREYDDGVHNGLNAMVSAATGSVLRTFPEQGPIAIDNGMIFGVLNDTLTATSVSTAAQIWTANNGIDIPATAPTVVDGVVYVGSATSKLLGYDENTGKALMQLPLTEAPSATTESGSDMAAGGGIIAIPAGTHLIAIGSESAELPPPAPQNLVSTASSVGLSLTWSPSQGATTYNIYRSTAEGAAFGVHPVGGVRVITFTDPTVAVGQTYYYVVTALNANGESGTSAEVSNAIPTTPPPTPTNLSAIAGFGTISLTWSPSVSATSYNLYRATAAGSEAAPACATLLTSTAYTDTNVIAGNTYYYVVKAVNAAGEGGPSNEASAVANVDEYSVTYRINPAHSAQATMPDLVLPLKVWWDVNLGSSVSYPVIANGYAYVLAGADLLALDLATGATLWTAHGANDFTFGGSLAYDNGLVLLVGNRPDYNEGGLLQAYDAVSGQLDWSTFFPGQWDMDSAPTALDGYVFTQSAGNVACIRERDGDLIWSTPQLFTMDGALAVTPSDLYIAGACGDTYSLSPTDGSIIWSLYTGCEGGGGNTCAYGNQRIFVQGYYDPYNNGTGIVDANSGTLLHLMPWSTPVALDNNDLYAVVNSALTAISLTDYSTPWLASFGADSPATAPIVVNANVYVASSGGYLYGCDELTGTQTVKLPLNETPSGTSESSVNMGAGEGLILIPCGNHLVAVGTQSGALAPAPPTNLIAEPGISQVDLYWTLAVHATGYTVLRSTESGSGYVPIGTSYTTTFRDSAVAPGTTYYYEVTAANASGSSGNSNIAAAAPAAAITYPAGVNFISMPYDYSTDTLADVFDNTAVTLFYYNADVNQYVQTPVSPADHVDLGAGYWVKFASPVSISAMGTLADPRQPFTIALPRGWSQIGDPFPAAISVSSLTFDNGQTSFESASNGAHPFVGPVVWGYSPATNQYIAATTLEPGQAYWIQALGATNMTVNYP